MDKCSGDIHQSLLLIEIDLANFNTYPAAILDRQPVFY